MTGLAVRYEEMPEPLASGVYTIASVYDFYGADAVLAMYEEVKDLFRLEGRERDQYVQILAEERGEIFRRMA